MPDVLAFGVVGLIVAALVAYGGYRVQCPKCGRWWALVKVSAAQKLGAEPFVCDVMYSCKRCSWIGLRTEKVKYRPKM